MRAMDYPNVAPAPFGRREGGDTATWLPAAVVVGGGSALLWCLILYALWQLF